MEKLLETPRGRHVPFWTQALSDLEYLTRAKTVLESLRADRARARERARAIPDADVPVEKKLLMQQEALEEREKDIRQAAEVGQMLFDKHVHIIEEADSIIAALNSKVNKYVKQAQSNEAKVQALETENRRMQQVVLGTSMLEERIRMLEEERRHSIDDRRRFEERERLLQEDIRRLQAELQTSGPRATVSTPPPVSGTLAPTGSPGSLSGAEVAEKIEEETAARIQASNDLQKTLVELQSMRTQYDGLKMEHDKLTIASRETEAEYHKTLADLEELKGILSGYERDLGKEKASKVVNKWQAAAGQSRLDVLLKEAKSELLVARKEKAEVEDTLLTVRKEFDQAKVEIRSLNTHNAELKEELAGLHKRMDVLTKESEALRAEVEDLQKRIKDLNLEKKRLEGLNASLKDKYTGVIKNLMLYQDEEIEMDLRTIKGERNRLAKFIHEEEDEGEDDILAESLTALDKLRTEYRRRLDEYVNERDTYLAQIRDYSRQLHETKGKGSEWLSELREMKLALEGSNNKVRQLQEAQLQSSLTTGAEVHKLTDANKHLEEELNDARKALEMQKKEYGDLLDDIRSSALKISSEKEEMDSMKEKVDYLSRFNEDLVVQVETLKAENKDLVERIGSDADTM